MTPRQVRLVLVDASGEPLGTLGPVEVASPWWPDVEPVVQAVRERHGLALFVLRVLAPADDDGTREPGGGEVTYLAQPAGPVTDEQRAGLEPLGMPLDALAAALADQPLRAPWARLGGPASILAWADDVLSRAGTPRTGPAEQVKTWNLSSILRLPTANGPVWCKSAPPFFAHEGAIIAAVGRRHPRLVPQVLASDPLTCTVLMADVPGQDQWDAGPQRLAEMVEAVVDLQDEWVGHTDELLGLGLPDWRGAALADALAGLLARSDVRARFETAELDGVDALAARLPVLVAELDACGLGDTLVHGDLHAGNWRHGPRGLLLLDWGDSGVGHPLLDLPAFLERLPPEQQDDVRAGWVQQWRARRPDADVERAIALVRPLAALRQALIYRAFLDQIEPDERIYHRDDPPVWIRRALQLNQALQLNERLQLSQDEPPAR